MDKKNETLIKSCGNVFIDLGFSPAEASVMHMRVEAMVRITQRIKENAWTKTDTARHLGISQLDVDQLVMSKLDSFSLDKLLILAIRAGLHVHLEWKDDDQTSDLL